MKKAELDGSINPVESPEQAASADDMQGDAQGMKLSFNADGSGIETITHPDGSTTEMEFNALKGCVLLGREYCTSPEVVAHAPQRFALDYTAKMMRELQQRAGRVQQGDMPDEGKNEAQQPESYENGIGDTVSSVAPERNSALASTASDPQQGEQSKQPEEMHPPAEPETLAGVPSDVTA